MITVAWKRFVSAPSSAGVVLALSVAAALLVGNSPWRSAYEAWLAWPGELRLGADWLVLSKPLIVWINELWMAVFFFAVGLEIKRELRVGELATLRQAALPCASALGGMVVPALIYAAINLGNPVALRGWAIASATDIAFALSVLILLGRRAPASLKVFLTAVAIMDDLGAILVIALFYAHGLSLPMLGGALAMVLVLVLFNRLGVTALVPYGLVGLVLWVFVLKSGVHATVAGVVTAFAVPLSRPEGGSPLLDAEHALQPWVAYLILPVFAFANAGVWLGDLSPGALLHTVPLGIVLGLMVGKPLGVFAGAWLMVKLAHAQFPPGANSMQFLGMCILCGVGFTMSLFIGSLAFTGEGAVYGTEAKLGVLAGSMVCAVLGAAVLWRAERRSGKRPYH